MNSKQYAVLGLGIFGSTVATTLAEYGCEVIAVDQDESCVAIGTHLEEAVLATMNLKELGVPYVIAKAKNKQFMKILEKVGANKVIRAEKDMGLKVAKSLLRKSIVDLVELDEDYSVVEIKAPLDWVGKNFIDLNIRRVYNMNIIGIKHGDEDHLSLDVAPEYVIQNGDHFLVIGKTKELERFDYMTK